MTINESSNVKHLVWIIINSEIIEEVKLCIIEASADTVYDFDINLMNNFNNI
jgi:hypothetical protein